MNKLTSILICILSGLLTGLSQINESLWFLIFFSLIPLFCVISNSKSFKNTAFYFSIYTATFFFVNISWLFNIKDILPLGKMNFLGILLILLILIAIQIICFLIPFSVFHLIKKNAVYNIFLFSAFYMLGEWLNEFIPFFAFPWCRLSISAVPFTAFIQSASLLGSLFITFIICIINCSFAVIIMNYKSKKNIMTSFLIYTFVFLGNIFFGIGYQNYVINITKNSDMAEISIIKDYAEQNEKWDKNINEIAEEYLKLSKESLTDKTKAVIWSETAVNTNLENNLQLKEKLTEFCINNNVSLITGLITYSPEKFNSVVEISSDGTFSKTYSKQILVPFGEFIPFEDFFKSKIPELKNYNSFSKHTESVPIDTVLGNTGVVICFESIFPRIAREITNNGAELLVIVSNDSWFKDSPAVAQHHSHAILRAVENGRYIARCSTGGTSSVITPSGLVITGNNELYLNSNIIKLTNRTLYSRIGDIIILFPIILTAHGYIKIITDKISKHRRNISKA